jgi:uncharacterized membrane protein
VVNNVRRILAVEYVCAARAIEFRAPLTPSLATGALLALLRTDILVTVAHNGDRGRCGWFRNLQPGHSWSMTAIFILLVIFILFGILGAIVKGLLALLI